MRKKVIAGLIVATMLSGCGSVATGTLPATTDPSVPTAESADGRGHAQTGQARGATAPSPAIEQSAITFLMREYSVSRPEAERRLKLQQEAPALGAKLAAQHPGEYAGLWLDQANGGVLRVGMTDPALVPSLPGVAAFPAKRSLRSLEDIAARVSAAAPGAEVSLDPIAGEVVVRGADSAAKAVDPQAVRIAESLPGWEFKCDTRWCADAPLRGGVRLDIQRVDGSVGGCSMGFHLQSKVTKKRYILTAGHCVLGSTHAHVDSAFHQWYGPKLPVSIEDANTLLTENEPGGNLHDYAVMPLQPAGEAYWLGGANGRLHGPLPISTHAGVLINGFLPAASVVPGSTVCASGSGYTPAAGESYVDSGAGTGYVPGTRCGIVESTGSRITVKICARKGDSGGPLFTPDGKALGVLSGGDPGSGACTNPNERNWYSPISRIFDRLTERTGSTYQFELVPQPGAETSVPRM